MEKDPKKDFTISLDCPECGKETDLVWVKLYMCFGFYCDDCEFIELEFWSE